MCEKHFAAPRPIAALILVAWARTGQISTRLPARYYWVDARAGAFADQVSLERRHRRPFNRREQEHVWGETTMS